MSCRNPSKIWAIPRLVLRIFSSHLTFWRVYFAQKQTNSCFATFSHMAKRKEGKMAMADFAETVQTLFAAFERKNLSAVLALFADDALVYDPHYPQATMKGMKAIQRGLTWGMATLKQPGFTI